jgi:N-acetylmuramoyl-L-alanine amidase
MEGEQPRGGRVRVVWLVGLAAVVFGALVGLAITLLCAGRADEHPLALAMQLPPALDAFSPLAAMPAHEARPAADLAAEHAEDREVLPPRLVRPAGSYLVVLDPGHGGSNTGAAGVIEGVFEKRLTLAMAYLVAARLEQVPGVIVIMTRTEDRYLTLRARSRLANAVGADAFVSLHFNASPGRAQRGFETWVLAPEAMAVDAHAIRAGDGPLRPGVPDDVAAILDDVERNAAQDEALALAAGMQARLAQVWGPTNDRGVRQGSQDVLMGLTMPAVLVEMGFIDQAVEGQLLLDAATRDRLADAVARAILDRRPALTALR